MTGTLHLFSIALWGILLCGCLQGTEYRRPSVPLPSSWSAIANTEDAPISSDHGPDVEWWKSFQNDELSQLIELALRQNHDIRRAIARVMEGRASVMSATAGLYPQVNLSSSVTNLAISENTLAGVGLSTGRQPSPQVFAAPGTSFNLWNGSMDLRWELDFWGRVRRGREAAEADARAIEEDVRAVALSLIADVGHAYFRIRELDEQLEIATGMLALRQESLDIIRTRASAGLASDLDVKRAEVLVAEAAGLIPDFARMRAVESHRLEILTGLSPGTLNLAPKPLRSTIVQPEIPVGLPSHLLERRPDILQAEASLAASNARIGQARAYFFPILFITGQGGVQSVDLANWLTGNSLNYSIGPSVILPIFQGGTNLARLDQAESRYRQMLEQYHQTILQAFREVADLLTALRTRKEQLARQRERLSAAEAALGLAEIRYRKGLVNYLDVLDAQRAVLEARTEAVITERARLTDMVSLFKALGGGWVRSVVEPSS